MSVITLTSDMGLKDHYVAALKGTILSQHIDAKIVDISHEIHPFSILEAGFILRNCYHHFPKGSVHIVCVDDFMTSNGRYIAVEHNGHYFIAGDSGVLSIIIADQPQRIIELEITAEYESSSLAGNEILAKAGGYLARGGTLEFLGSETTQWNKKTMFTPTTTDTEILGSIVYVDGYGNAISNIDKRLFELIGKSRPFDLYINRNDNVISRISTHYNDVPEGEKVALFGVSGNLEIAINRGTPLQGGGAKELLNLQYGNPIRIEFADVTNS